MPNTLSFSVYLFLCNYGITTTATVEWHFVTRADDGPQQVGRDEWPEERSAAVVDESKKRKPRTEAEIEELNEMLNGRLMAINENMLMKEELFAGILYTGPMFFGV